MFDFVMETVELATRLAIFATAFVGTPKAHKQRTRSKKKDHLRQAMALASKQRHCLCSMRRLVVGLVLSHYSTRTLSVDAVK